MSDTGKIRNISGEDRIAGLDTPLRGRLVEATQVVEVPVEDVYSFTVATSTWEPADEAAQAAHDKGAAEELERVRAELGDAYVKEADAAAHPPKKNAGVGEWREWVVATGALTEEQAAELSRQELIDNYAPQEG